MTTRDVYVCDGCGKSTLDFYHEIGWLVFDKGVSVVVTRGRDSDGHAKSYSRSTNPSAAPAHFCSVECLLRWIYGSNLVDMDIHLGLEGLYE
jgi:hypothetical protein